ncbi:MAG TPA: hypothetical protein VGQ15_16525 [Gaiellaceae bacterium]|jgi:hypothetical protein|nr:hypothetical protein [Gaiellaceae bacterium]
MAELNDVLGAILRDLAQARVTADLFSQTVSAEYQPTGVLSGFSVPRVEVTQASIDLKFAVNSVERREADPRAIVDARVRPFATQLARQVYSELVATDPRGDEIEAILREKNVVLETQLELAVESVVSANQPDVDAAMAGRPEGLARKVQGELASLVLADADVKEVLTRGTRVRDIRERVSVNSAASVSALAAAAEKARSPEGEIDVGAVPVREFAVRLADRVYEDVVLAHPRRDEVLRVAADRGLALDQQLRASADQILSADPEAVRVALEQDPDALVETLESQLTDTLLEAKEVRAVFTRRGRVTDVRTRLATAVTPAIAAFAKEVRDAVQAAQRQATAIDVAVTTGELAEVSDTLVSQINVVAEVRNYEWVTSGGEAIPAQRLQPE